MVLNEFDVYREALKKIDLSEAALPIYHGRLLTENADVFCKLQKLLACPDMESCHMWLYDLDVENLSESECQKVCNLYQLALDRGCFPDEEAPAEELPAEEPPAPVPVAQPAPQKPKLPMAAYTVVYSAMRGGEIKTGEAYSNAISTRAAKADVLAKLDRAGYQNVTILAIEAGDPDCCGCSDVEPAPEEDLEVDTEVGVAEADDHEPMSHAFDSVGVKASTANICGQDEVRMLINEEDIKRKMRKAYEEASAEIDGDPAFPSTVSFLQSHMRELQQLKEILAKTDKQAASNLALICSSLSRGKVQIDESTGFGMLCRALCKILLTIFKYMALGCGFGGQAITWISKLLAAGADKLNQKLGEAEEDEKQLGEADGDEEEAGGEEEEKEEDGEEDSGEDAVEPDEELNSGDDGEEPKDDEVSQDKELSDQEKSQLRDGYKKAFKAAMAKCKFTSKSFDQLDLKQKTKFFTELSKAWGDKADPVKFMSQKETEALEQIVVKA